MADLERNRRTDSALSTASIVAIILLVLFALVFVLGGPFGRRDATTTSAPQNSGEATREVRPQQVPSPSPTSPDPTPGTTPAEPAPPPAGP